MKATLVGLSALLCVGVQPAVAQEPPMYRLTTGAFPAWSPDCNWIAYVDYRESQLHIFVIPSTGGQATQVTTTACPAWDQAWLSWSPDGSRIAFTERDFPLPDEIWVVPATGGSPVRLTTDSGFCPTWSPESDRIAFSSLRSDVLGDIWVMPATGEPPATQLTVGPAADQYPSWSPDGTRIAFLSDRAHFFNVWVMPAGGGTPSRVTTTSGADDTGRPTWSPDSAWIAFATLADGGGLWAIPASGGRPVLLTTRSSTGQLSWSPDGSRIAFSVPGLGGWEEIWVMEMGGITRVPDAPPGTWERTWGLIKAAFR